MATTSLAQQLQKLKAPQSSIYKESTIQVSLLFNPSEAASKDRDTFYEIGLSGLQELIALCPDFSTYQDTLFSRSSKEFERAVQSKEVNQNLDQNIEKFLLQLSPYYLLQSAHKTLEWLINRYHIHQYNQDAMMALILPYHGTMIFVRCVQLMDLKYASNRWIWLVPIKKNGIPLGNQVLYNQCASNMGTLQFIAKMVLKYVQEYKERATQLNTIYAFFCQVAVGTISTVKNVSEGMITALLPTLMKGIESPIADFRASCYIIIGYLFTKTKLKEKTLNQILDRMLTTEFDLSYDVVLLIVMMYEHQKHITKMSDVIFNISVDMMHTFCGHIKVLVAKKTNIRPFVLAFLKKVLPLAQRGVEEFKTYSPLPDILIEEVDLKNQDPEKIIMCILDAYQLPTADEQADGESDIEIIDEEDFSSKIIKWYAILLKNIERQYPDAFDKVITSVMNSESDITPKRQRQLSKLLGFKPAIAHKVGGTYLFENLNHTNPNLRMEAVRYIEKEFRALKLQNPDFVKESILERFNDDHIAVVNAALEISNESLAQVLNEVDVTNAFIRIISKRSKKWKATIKTAIVKFCSLNLLPVNQDTVLAILPLLFPRDEKELEICIQIMKSQWGQKFELTNKASKKLQNLSDYSKVNQKIFQVLFIDNAIDFDDLLNENQLDKNDTLNICFYLLLKTCTFKKAAVEEVTALLNLLLESVENRSIVQSTGEVPFSAEIMPEFIMKAKENKMLFEVIKYIFSKVIEDVNIKGVTKPWCNMLRTIDMILIRRLYEICMTGCAIPGYGENYVELLQKLLDKFFSNPKEKFDFVANFACGHILYATDPKDVIAPELQLRSIKLLINFIAVQNNAKWLFDSDVVIMVILLNLNNPIAAIRECIVDFIEKLLREKPDNKLLYVKLLEELLVHRSELLLDPNQIQQVLKTIFTQKDQQQKLFRRNCLLRLTGLLSEKTPSHIKSAFLKILSHLDNASTFPLLTPCLSPFTKSLKDKENNRLTFDIYESNLFRSVFSFINESTVTTFTKDQVWNIIELGLKEYRECVLEEDQSFTSPAVLIMRQLTEDVFGKAPDEKRKQLVYLISLAGAVSNNSKISSVASKVMKKIQLAFEDFKPILEGMVNAEDPADNAQKKKKHTVSMLSYQLAETNEWRLGVTLLEYVQSKKKMKLDNTFVTILFHVLKRCLRFEEQSHVEYTKQLILSSLWYFCKKYVNDKDAQQLKSLKNIFDVDLVVQCIRGTQNPQTHHHALILLSHAAYMLPEQVLNHTMEIFTFMGSSVLRHDDAYSFQIITKIIETLIPILVKLDKNIEDHTEKELQQLQNRVVPVLRIFADVVLHVPEHRRLPLFKKLLETLGPSQFLWVFLALLIETHIAHFNEPKKKDKRQSRTLADRESPLNRLDFGQNVVLEFPPEVCLENFIKLILYIRSLPIQKDDESMETDIDPSEIFSVNGHTAIQLRHYKYVIITFMNACLASSRFIHHCGQAMIPKEMETHYKNLIVNILTFIQSISKVSDEKTAKYWRVMLHHSYDLLDHTNNLLSAQMFLGVVKGLLKYPLQTVRRKSMELLNSKIQNTPEIFAEVDKEILHSLIPELLDIVKTVENKDTNLSDVAAQELELNQQTALLSLKLLTRMLAAEDPEPFKAVLEVVTEYTCNQSISGNVMASIVLCLAELCSNLKAHALVSLRRFMPALIKVLKRQRKAETPELILLSTVTAIAKIVESLPLFLSPYLQKVLYEYSILLAKWQAADLECSKVSAIVTKLSNIRKKIADSIPPRVLIPVVSETHQLLLEKEKFDAIGPVMSVLADSFANVTPADFTALQQDLTSLFLTALQLRSDAVDKNVDSDVVDRAEDEVVNALVSLVLKLSESSFRPLYFKIYDWAIRTNVDGHKDRAITFYRLSSAIAEKLKGLFVLFAAHFMKNAADLLDGCNNTKTEQLYFDDEEKCEILIKYIIKTLHVVFLYDSQQFVNKNRFETMMQPIVDQLENTVGGILNLKARAIENIIPCVSQFAVATADDSLWKLLNYQILLKTRNNDAEIRLTALDCLVAMATQLGSSWLPLLAESVPFLAELLEDGDQRIETCTKEAIRKLELILGEPLEKYF